MGKGSKSSSHSSGYIKGGSALTLSAGDDDVTPQPAKYNIRCSGHRFRPKGMTNIGNSCYANSVLQCLLSTALTQALMDPGAISVFRQYSFNLQILHQGSGSVDSQDSDDLKRKRSADDLKRKKRIEKERLQQRRDQELQDKCLWLTRELKAVTAQYVSIQSKLDMKPSPMDSLSSWFVTTDSPVVNPQSITRHPNRLSACLRPYQQEDAHEFLRALLETLAMNGRNKELSSLFDGLLESKITCQSCGKLSFTRDRYMDLSLDIANGDVGTLHDALGRFTQMEVLQGDNKVYCSKCEMKCCASKALRLATSPSILVCHLKRFAFDPSSGLTRLSKKVKFPQHLDISDYMSNLNQARPPAYELVAVLVHQGQSCEAGHYVAFVKSEGEWFLCNDREVHQVSVEKVMNQQAYILMYEVAQMREKNGFPSPSGSPVQKEPEKRSRSASDTSMFTTFLCGMEDAVVQNMCCVLSPNMALTNKRSLSRRARDDDGVHLEQSHKIGYSPNPAEEDCRRSFRKSNSSAGAGYRDKEESKPGRHRCFSGSPIRRGHSGSGSSGSRRPPRPRSASRIRSRRTPSLENGKKLPPRRPPSKRNDIKMQ